MWLSFAKSLLWREPWCRNCAGITVLPETWTGGLDSGGKHSVKAWLFLGDAAYLWVGDFYGDWVLQTNRPECKRWLPGHGVSSGCDVCWEHWGGWIIFSGAPGQSGRAVKNAGSYGGWTFSQA